MKKKIMFWSILLLTLLSCSDDEVLIQNENKQSNNSSFKGIICLVPNIMGDAEEEFKLEHVDGVKLRLGWKHIETKDSSFNWSIVDRYLDAADKYEKHLSISISGGSASPNWLYDLLPKEEYSESRGRNVPQLWSSTYVSKYIEFIEEFGNRYAQNKYLSHVTVSGIGFANEPVIPSPYGLDDLDDWGKAALQIIKTYINSFPNTKLSIPIHTQIPEEDTWDFFKKNILDSIFIYSETIGLEYHGLDATASNSEGEITDNYYKEIKEISKTRTTGFQFVCSTIANDVCDVNWVKGSSSDTLNLVDRTLKAGIENGADFIEVYPNDCKDSINITILENASGILKK